MYEDVYSGRWDMLFAFSFHSSTTVLPRQKLTVQEKGRCIQTVTQSGRKVDRRTGRSL
jgi:hypothetical protein